MSKEFIAFLKPDLNGSEIEYTTRALFEFENSNEYKQIVEFEKEISDYIGIENSIAVSNGTSAIHLSLKSLNVQQGDYVFCSASTFIASSNPILYEKAIPVFIDSDYETWNMCPKSLEMAFEWASKANKMPKCVVVVDLYGQSADYDKLLPICRKYNVPIIEDAAESLGAIYKGKRVGSLGDISVLSFNGNKVITTSSGGMILSNNKKYIEKIKLYINNVNNNQSNDIVEISYDYSMSSINASIGRAQLKNIAERLTQKKDIYYNYKNAFSNLPIKMMPIADYGEPNYWVSIFTINDDFHITPTEIIERLQKENIELRPFFKPLNNQPINKSYTFYTIQTGKSVAENLFEKAVCLPSSSNLTQKEQRIVIDAIKNVFKNF